MSLRPYTFNNSILHILVILSVVRNTTTQLVYDRLTLLKIQASVINLPIHISNKHSKIPPPVLTSVQPFLFRPECALPLNVRRRRRGKRGGILVKFKAYLVSRVANPGCFQSSPPPDHGSFDIQHSLRHCYWWLRLASAKAGPTLPCCRPVRVHSRSCSPRNLHLLQRDVPQPEISKPVCLAMLNVRSVSNKTFKINDLISTHDLDFCSLT